jgi:serine/threonine protein phosphatase 1
LTSVRRLESRGRPWWYEAWNGPELVHFGHTHSAAPRTHSRGGRLVALGLDTGCVYGGALSAYSPELDELIQVPARRHSAAMPR